MKSIIKSLALTGVSAVMCLLITMPAAAQRGGGGGGHGGGGGGGGGGHFGGGGGGGFSGAAHVGGGFSGGSHASAAPRSGGYSGARTGGYRTGTGSYRTGTGAYRAGGVRAGGTRQYVAGNHGAAQYGHGGAYGRYGWGSHYGWFYNGGFFGSLYYPWLGFGFGYLPWGCYPFYWGDAEYYYGDGFYYQNDGGQYTVVEPPIGAEVKSLPNDAKPIMINGEQYYEEKGVYYLPVKKDDGTTVYQITGKDGVLNTNTAGATSETPVVGDIVNTLPPDCRKVKLNGASYYVSEDGIYYQQTQDASGHTVYKIVALDGDNQGGQ
jgi:hypothetical protein